MTGENRKRTKTLGAMMIVGGLLAVVSAILPPGARGSDTLILGVGALAIALGILLFRTHRHLNEGWLGTVTAIGTGLVTATTAVGGTENGAADNEMLYVWVCLYSFYFFRLRHALGQLVLVAAAYAWLLGDQGTPLESGANQWLITVATLLVAGLLVARLRASLAARVDELSDRARRDSLTGLLNRRELQRRGAFELARRRRHATPLSLIAADLDGFKGLNDTLGHPAGDRVLRRVSRVLDTETREVDSVARVGGDEFVVLLPAADRDHANRVAERLRQAVRQFGQEGRLELTLSIGVAAADEGIVTLEDLWAAADGALYQAKRDGGDRVAFAAGRTGAAAPAGAAAS